MQIELKLTDTEQNISNIQYTQNDEFVVHMGEKDVVIPCYFTQIESDGLSFNKKINLLYNAIDNGISLDNRFVKKLYKAEHKDKTESFMKKWILCGELKCPTKVSKHTKESIEEAFKADKKRFHGRVPKIVDAMAIVSEHYAAHIERDIVEKFNIQNVRALLQAHMAPAEVVLLYTKLPADKMAQLSANPTYAVQVCKLIEKYCTTHDEKYKNGALWICNHLQSVESFIKKVVKNVQDIELSESSSIDSVKAQISNKKSLSEVEKIEKAYRKCHFKFENCKCDLKITESTCGKYKTEILRAGDTRAVMIGYDTDCCQHLGGAGESAMMHGLLHPKAGFWVLTNTNSGKVLAQAEVWEENDQTLVFDNIEFANDADIELYRAAIGTWLTESEYPNIKMGTGYNEMFYNGDFRHCDAVKPPVTPYEIYIISHEEDAECDRVFHSAKEAKQALDNGEVTYFDYIYCDSENDAVILKENGRVEPYFNVEASIESEEEEEIEYDC